MLNDYSGTQWMGTPWKKLEVKVSVVKRKTSRQTQSSSTFMTPTVGFLPYNLFRTNNSSLWFCLSPIVWIISIKWCSPSFMKWVNRWTIIQRMGHKQSLFSSYTLDQQEPECKRVSCLAVWHRFVNRHTVTNGSPKHHVPHCTFLLLHHIQLQHLNFLTCTCCSHKQQWAAFTNWSWSSISCTV